MNDERLKSHLGIFMPFRSRWIKKVECREMPDLTKQLFICCAVTRDQPGGYQARRHGKGLTAGGQFTHGKARFTSFAISELRMLCFALNHDCHNFIAEYFPNNHGVSCCFYKMVNCCVVPASCHISSFRSRPFGQAQMYKFVYSHARSIGNGGPS